ncbi:MAG: hypothetical protein IPI58_08910 [Alphaproteobacteria bacterium]|nr:MAG: hypothetical protein IPI58_08910 [Alphaproteobacteria bacterium]
MLDELTSRGDMLAHASETAPPTSLRHLVAQVERLCGRAVALRLFSLLEVQNLESAGVNEILIFLKNHADNAWRAFAQMRDNPFIHAEMGEQARSLYMEMLGRRYEEAAELHRVARNSWRNDSLHLEGSRA